MNIYVYGSHIFGNVQFLILHCVCADPSLSEMDVPVTGNLFCSERLICHELLAWLNETLQTGFTKVEQVCTGAAFCQLMNWLSPKFLDLSRVEFQSDNAMDAITNYSLLQAAFRKVGKDSEVALAFLRWFKAFFDKNVNRNIVYHPLEARGGQSMVPADLGMNSLVISDDDDDVTMELETQKRETTEKEEPPQVKVEQAKAAVDKGNEGSSDTLLRFIRRYCSDTGHTHLNTSTDTQVSVPSVSAILSPTHPTDIIMACSRTPYCLYLYVGVELGGGQKTSVVLVGYFDKSLGASVVRPLLTLQMSVDAVDQQTVAEKSTDNTDACLLIETLKKCDLVLYKVVAFYCNAPNPGMSRAIELMLQAFNPKLVSLCGLTGMATRACQAGLLASFSCVVDLIRDIRHNYDTYPPVCGSLKGLFSEPYNPSLPISAQCLFTTHAVQRIVGSWRPLVDYFKSLKQAQDTDRIRTQLMDHKVKLRFIFLSHMLEPLQALQKLQQCGTNVAMELQLTSMLVHTYAANILRPCVAECFTRKRDLSLILNWAKRLPIKEVRVGARAREFLWATAVVDLGEEERRDFLKDASTFYEAALKCLVESLPGHLGEVALTNINAVLKHSENIKMGIQLGLPSESHHLAYDYLKFTKTVKVEHCWAKPTLYHITMFLKIMFNSLFLFIFFRENIIIYALTSCVWVIQDVMGELVWGEVQGFSPWPAIIIPCSGETQLQESRMVQWYGQNMSSQVSLQALKPFAAFAQHFCSNSLAILVTYREALFLSLQEAALRCKKHFSECVGDRDELLKQMLDWAIGGFQPMGNLFDGSDEDKSPDFLPNKKRAYTKSYKKVNQASSDYIQPDQKRRGFCLCCGTEDIEICHPLFKGSLCSNCEDNLKETLYRYDEDGYQSYCTICCYGLEVIMCGNDSCCRSYCRDCLSILVGPGTFDSLKLLDPWICYLCQPHRPHGALIPREDWSIRVQELFANNSAMAFEPHRVYPSIPANLRRPLRVLALFDGIATGYLVLKDLGIKVETYVASEVCEDSLAVAVVNHDGKINHIGDIDRWGPFDLLIGGSPCNDLSIVNPFRKGLYEGTGRLFFDFYRILQLLKPKEEDPRPFFWLFENVVFMNRHDKVNICRFLECNPVLVNAVEVSPAHRARCFWGNIPGMSRPITASKNDKLNLQDCLEIGREARVSKVRTITTNPNSLKQCKGGASLLPVLQNGKEDNLWITELEKIFGFPKHYTDVRNMNRQQRQKVLGKAWSVPVIRHLFAPLKDYFACEELPPLTTSNYTHSPPPSASPELQQLR
uniref:DNA (cytosine-5-)-methyltransferase n=1 Tax=Cyclopterus lumpus TaxID=8103 RepID=A0A8C3G0D2_CYCLU